MIAYAEARLDQRAPAGRSAPKAQGAPWPPVLAREVQYWQAATLLQQGQAADALAAAERGLQLLGDSANDEARWRITAIATLALRAAGHAGRARDMHTRSQQALARLRTTWQGSSEAYATRPDLAELIARLGPGQTVTGR
jgi:hypothetical protein